jgi:hypothetical protein
MCMVRTCTPDCASERCATIALLTAASVVSIKAGVCTGILMGAAVLGVLVNRAAIPQARVVFSDHCLLTSRNGEPCLILRVGNTRGNFLLNPEIRLGYLTARPWKRLSLLSPLFLAMLPAARPRAWRAARLPRLRQAQVHSGTPTVFQHVHSMLAQRHSRRTRTRVTLCRAAGRSDRGG